MERVSLNIQPDISSLSHTAAESLLVLVQQAANEGRRFKIALAGGSTPRSLYTQLARPDYIDRMPWNSVDFFFWR